ncbi:MAG: hypothetical protein GW833_03105 [Desulfuromonadales bacterium]|nr:hypothetical protein [Desulfuromonadales bacterium]
MGDENKNLQDLGEAEWDAICARCGRCCYEKIDFNGKIFYTAQPCVQLDPVSHACRVYRQRDQVQSDCQRLTPENISAGFLPADCPYVRNITNYSAPILNNHGDKKK